MAIGLRRIAAGLFGAAWLLGLNACGTSWVSKGLTDDGRVGEVVFPDIRKDAWHREGTHADAATLRRIVPGTSKDQLYALLGRPHFQEGLVDVREWDYVFNLRMGNGNETVLCQYKVIFDTQYKARTFHWSPASCAARAG